MNQRLHQENVSAARTDVVGATPASPLRSVALAPPSASRHRVLRRPGKAGGLRSCSSPIARGPLGIFRIFGPSGRILHDVLTHMTCQRRKIAAASPPAPAYVGEEVLEPARRPDAGEAADRIEILGAPCADDDLDEVGCGGESGGGCLRAARAPMIAGWVLPRVGVGHGVCGRPHRQSGGDRGPHRADGGGDRPCRRRGVFRRTMRVRCTCSEPGAARRGCRAGCRRLPRPGGDPRRRGAREM